MKQKNFVEIIPKSRSGTFEQWHVLKAHVARQYKLPFKLVHGAWQVHFFDGDFARAPLGGAENFHANVTRVRPIIFCRDILDDLLVDRFRIFKVFNV